LDKERQIEGYDRDKIDERARRVVVVPLGDLEQLKEYIMLLSNRQIRICATGIGLCRKANWLEVRGRDA